MNVKPVRAKNGHLAILARRDSLSPWVQVESVVGEEVAQALIDELENDEDKRLEYINDFSSDDWGQDAPAEQI